jgi:transposase InsO family protein
VPGADRDHRARFPPVRREAATATSSASPPRASTTGVVPRYTKYVGDITYLPVSGAKPLYLATVIDLASRRLAGWAIADHMRTELVIDALAAAEGAWPVR